VCPPRHDFALWGAKTYETPRSGAPASTPTLRQQKSTARELAERKNNTGWRSEKRGGGAQFRPSLPRWREGGSREKRNIKGRNAEQKVGGKFTVPIENPKQCPKRETAQKGRGIGTHEARKGGVEKRGVSGKQLKGLNDHGKKRRGQTIDPNTKRGPFCAGGKGGPGCGGKVSGKRKLEKGGQEQLAPPEAVQRKRGVQTQKGN